MTRTHRARRGFVPDRLTSFFKKKKKTPCVARWASRPQEFRLRSDGGTAAGWFSVQTESLTVGGRGSGGRMEEEVGGEVVLRAPSC